MTYAFTHIGNSLPLLLLVCLLLLHPLPPNFLGGGENFSCVKAQVIDLFRATALLPLSTLITIYLNRARVRLTL